MWNDNDEFVGACGTMIGKNLNGDPPHLLAVQHAITCHQCLAKLFGSEPIDP
jgi:hypothetical protein